MKKIMLATVLALSASAVMSAEHQEIRFDHGSAEMTQPHKVKNIYKKQVRKTKKQNVRKKYEQAAKAQSGR